MLEERVAKLLSDASVLTLASTGGPLAPWIIPAYFAESDPFLLDILVDARCNTMVNLLTDDRIAVLVQSADGLEQYARGEGRAHIMPRAEERTQTRIVTKTPAAAAFVFLPHLVAVRLEIDRWRLTDVGAGYFPARDVRKSGHEGLLAHGLV